MQGIRAVCFDLDNTLWDIWPVILRAEQAVLDFLAHYPESVAGETLQSMRAARESVALRYPQQRHDFSFLRQQALREQCLRCGCGEQMAEQAFEVFLRARNRVELYAEVAESLQLLQQRYRLFTASNGNADLSRIGIAHWFERSIHARDVGALKPAAVVFHKVVEATDLQLQEVLYVGDDPLADVEGARLAGMRAVWINRDAASWPVDLARPEHTVTSLKELAHWLGCTALAAGRG
jgi:FMN hydrolase / 5-amino-6-(5-phospho-D-ribitylamino)uracil phosphatase